MEIEELRNGFLIGDYTVYPNRTQLVSDNGVEHLEPKVMQVLVLLASSARSVVTRRVLLGSLWSEVVVGDECLTRCVSLLRKALRDSARSPAYIRTVPRIGYELLVDPKPINPASLAEATSGQQTRLRQVFSWLRNTAPVRFASAALVSAWLTLQLLDLAITIAALPMSTVVQVGLIIAAVVPSLTAITWLVRAAGSDSRAKLTRLRLPAVFAVAVALAWVAAGLVASQHAVDDVVRLAGSVSKGLERIPMSARIQVEEHVGTSDTCQQASNGVLSAAAETED